MTFERWQWWPWGIAAPFVAGSIAYWFWRLAQGGHAGVLGWAYVGGLFVLLLVALVQLHPRLRVDEAGVRFSPGGRTIPWSDVAGARILAGRDAYGPLLAGLLRAADAPVLEVRSQVAGRGGRLVPLTNRYQLRSDEVGALTALLQTYQTPAAR